MRGQIWQSFNPAVHVIEPFAIPKEWPKQIAVDFGYDNPLTMLWIAKNPITETKYVYRQLYKTGLLVRQACEIGKTVSNKCGEVIRRIVADHDAENRAQFEEYWQETLPARKDVMSGIQAVEEMFMPGADGKCGVYIFNDSWSERDGYWYGNLDFDPMLKEEGKPTCLQEEIPIYKWGKDDKPIKENDHACDALRYDIYTENELEGKGGIFGKIRHQESYSRR
jgi:phage terminase large subunit